MGMQEINFRTRGKQIGIFQNVITIYTKYITGFTKVVNQNTVKSLTSIAVIAGIFTALIEMLNVYALNVKLNLRSVTEIIKYLN